MVELTLPKNSKVGEGKVWPKPAGAKGTREYRIYRWNPDDGQNPRIDTYYVDTHDCGPMILDALLNGTQRAAPPAAHKTGPAE